MKEKILKEDLTNYVTGRLDNIEPLIIPTGVNLISEGVKIALELIVEQFNLDIDLKNYPNRFLANTSDLISKQKIKYILEIVHEGYDPIPKWVKKLLNDELKLD